MFWSIFERFWTIFGMHVCIRFVDRILIALTMFFLTKVQMCYSAETLKKLISHRFLHCFVKVPFFRTRKSKHQIFAESIKVWHAFSIENWPKNQSKIDIFEHSESHPILNRFVTQFWPHFWFIFGGFGVSWGSLAPILAALDSPKPLPRGPLDSLGVPEDPPRPPGPPRDFDLNRFWFPRDQIWTGFDKNSALAYTGALSSLHHSAGAYTGATFSKKYRSRLHRSVVKLAP